MPASLIMSTHLLDGGVHGSEQKVDGGLAEGGEPLNGKVLVVTLSFPDLLLGLQGVSGVEGVIMLRMAIQLASSARGQIQTA